MGNAKRIDKQNTENLLIEYLPEVIDDEEIGIKLLDAHKVELLNSHFFDQFGSLIGLLNTRKELLKMKVKNGEKKLRLKLEKKYNYINHLESSEQIEVVIQEVNKIFDSKEFKLAQKNQTNGWYNRSYQIPKPKVYEIKKKDGKRTFFPPSLIGFDIVNFTQSMLDFEFAHSKESPIVQRYIKNMVGLMFATLEGLQFDEDNKPETCIDFSQLIKNTVPYRMAEFGELYCHSTKLVEYIFSVITLINEDAITKEGLNSLNNNLLKGKSYKKSEDFVANGRLSLMRLFTSHYLKESNQAEELVHILVQLNSYILRNSNHSPDIGAKKSMEGVELTVNDFQLCNITELIKARKFRSEFELSYDPELAQGLDGLIKSRIEQMRDRVTILQNQNPNIKNEDLLQKIDIMFGSRMVKDDIINDFGDRFLSQIKSLEVQNKSSFFDTLDGITFSKQAKEAYLTFDNNGTKVIAKKIESLLNKIVLAGGVGKFVAYISKGDELLYGWHDSKHEYSNCILFKLNDQYRLVIDHFGNVIFIGDYHDRKK